METPAEGRRQRSHPLLLALVLALPLVRGLWRLGTPNVWFDEAATWQGVTGSWRGLLDHALRGDDCGGILGPPQPPTPRGRRQPTWCSSS